MAPCSPAESGIHAQCLALSDEADRAHVVDAVDLAEYLEERGAALDDDWPSNRRPADYVEPARSPLVLAESLHHPSVLVSEDLIGRGRMGRMFPFRSHPGAGSRLAGLRVVAARPDSSPRVDERWR